MRINTKVVIDSETYRVVLSDGYAYFGPLALCKGDSTAQQAETQQNQFDQQLMQIFQSQYANQTNILNYLKSSVQPIIAAGGTGYTPAQLTAMRTNATDTLANQYQNAEQALGEQVSAASGGSKLTGASGAVTEENAALLNQEAQAQSTAQENITTENANLQQQNYWNAINTLNGVAAQTNPLGYSSAATGGSRAVAGLSNANTNANKSGLLGTLGSSFGGAFGGVLSGGAGNALGGLPGIGPFF